MSRDTEWRSKEPSLKEVQAKYSNLPKLFILKADMQRRGIVYSRAALDKVDPAIHQSYSSANVFAGRDDGIVNKPTGLILNDGSTLTVPDVTSSGLEQRDPYIIDVVNDKVVVVDEGEVLAEVGFWEKPDFYDKFTSDGTPMSKIATTRPQRLDFFLSSYCHFWDKPGEGCKYCGVSPNYLKAHKNDPNHDPMLKVQHIREVTAEALKEEGRYSAVLLCSGSILSGKKIFDDEVDAYIEALQAIGESFATKRFPSQIVSSAFDEEQMARIYENTGLMSYCTDLEVLSKEKFGWVCPGKEKYIGFDEWKRRLKAAVDIFGRGNVSTVIVHGTELATPNGFTDKEEAFKVTSEIAEELAQAGVGVGTNIWRAADNSIFAKQKTPDLEYYIRMFNEIDRLHHKYEVNKYADDYRRCGQHLPFDLERI